MEIQGSCIPPCNRLGGGRFPEAGELMKTELWCEKTSQRTQTGRREQHSTTKHVLDQLTVDSDRSDPVEGGREGGKKGGKKGEREKSRTLCL